MKAEGGEGDACGAERWDALLQGPRGNPAGRELPRGEAAPRPARRLPRLVKVP